MASSTWINAAGGSWASGANWSAPAHHVPVAGDTANITNAFAGADYDVQITDSESASVVNIGAANATLDVEAGGILTPTTINLTARPLRVLSGAEIVCGTILAPAGTSFPATHATTGRATRH